MAANELLPLADCPREFWLYSVISFLCLVSAFYFFGSHWKAGRKVLSLLLFPILIAGSIFLAINASALRQPQEIKDPGTKDLPEFDLPNNPDDA